MEMMYESLWSGREICTAFCYRYTIQMIQGMKQAYFLDKKHSLVQRLQMARNVLESPDFIRVVKNIDLKQLPERKAKFKIWLMKKRMFLLLELIWAAQFVR